MKLKQEFQTERDTAREKEAKREELELKNEVQQAIQKSLEVKAQEPRVNDAVLNAASKATAAMWEAAE